MARYLYSELAATIQARRDCAQSLHCQFCGKSIWRDTDSWRHDSSGTMPICNNNPLPLNEGHAEWFDRHEDRILSLVKEYMPSGSGIDSGTQIDLDASHADKLVFTTSYHHMNDGGYYDGWTEHTVTVTPALQGAFNLRITGRNRNDIKEYLYEVFDSALRQDTEEYSRAASFADVPDWNRCASCYGAATVTHANGRRYCEGCAKYHAAA